MDEKLKEEIKEYIKENLSIQVRIHKSPNYDLEKHLIDQVYVRLYLENELISEGYAS
jgi:hypothetical protein